MKPRIAYRRLPGRRMGFLRCASAWLGADHILLIGGTRFHETYRRVDLRDAQALVMRRARRFVMKWPYVMLAVIGLLTMIPVSATFRAIILITGVAAIVAWILVSLRFGCYLDIVTAVGNVRVEGVASVLTAGRFSKKVTAAISLAQEALYSPALPPPLGAHVPPEGETGNTV